MLELEQNPDYNAEVRQSCNFVLQNCDVRQSECGDVGLKRKLRRQRSGGAAAGSVCGSGLSHTEVPQFVHEPVEHTVEQIIPQKRVSHRTVEQFVDVLVQMTVEEVDQVPLPHPG